jgi:hypothetical protein
LYIRLSFIFLFLLGFCTSGQSLNTEKTHIQLKREFQQVLMKQIEKADYHFLLIGKMKNKKYEFMGHQLRNDWSLKHKQNNNFYIEKKAENITMIIDKEKETMTTKQFGIISPLDHLLLVRETGSNIAFLNTTSIKNQKVNHVKINIDQKKLVVKLKRRFMSPYIDLSRYFSGKYQVVYHFYFEPTSRNLIMLKTNIYFSLKGKNKDESTELIYFFL